MIRVRTLAPHALPLGIYAILTLALTWPIAIHPASLVPHDLGDPLLSTWVLWWNAHVLPFSEKWWNGPLFFPASSTLTFSDHRVGLGIISTPAILLGASPLAAHNAVFLLTFFLSAASAYALCFSLTRSREASLIGGLVFGFNPYRADHLPHLELLASYWLPVTLLSLHRWSVTRKGSWLVAASVSLLMQALTCGYYFFFFGVLLLLWLVWFVPRSLSIRQSVALGLALVAPLIVIAPILLRYRQAHTSLGLSRTIGDIEFFSADVLGLATTPDLLALWNSPAEWMRPEGAIFPGVTGVLLVIVALLWHGRPVAVQSSRVQIARRVLIISSAAAAMVALIPPLIGPVGFDVMGVRVSTSSSYKPLSVALLLAVCWLLTSPAVRQAWRTQTPLAFYTLATIAMWMFALGPTARFLGQRVLYKAPYSWLMILPGFRDEFRVPSRFAMLAVLTLAVAAAVAFQKLFARGSTQTTIVAACILGMAVVAESWIEPFPVEPAPAPLMIPAAVPDDAVIAELPLGIFEDGIAMYHSMLHQRPVVNGLSGYDPAHYRIVRDGLREGSLEVLSPIARHASVAIFVRREDDSGLVPQLTRATAARSIAVTPSHEVLLLPRARIVESAARVEGTAIPVRGLTSLINAQDLPRMIDGDLSSRWSTNAAQDGHESFAADLGDVFDVSSVVLEGAILGYPRAIAIELSLDGITWSQAWHGPTAERSVAAAIENPRVVPLALGFPIQPAQHVRVRQTGHSRDGWSVAELRILGSASSRQ